MKVLFIEVDSERDWAVAALGPSFIAAFLRQYGHEVHFLRVPLDMSADGVVARIGDIDPGLLGVSLTTRQWQRARRLMGMVRRRIATPVAAGGLHPTFAPEDVLAAPGFDYVCLGEGEEATLELVAALEAGLPTDNIRNIWARGAARPALRPPFTPLDRMPFMARDMLDEPEGVVHMSTQRGCPFPCTYCGARKFHDLYEGFGNYGRRRSHRSVLSELFHIQRQRALSYVIFLDDTFTINHPWVKEFCRVYGERIHLPFWIHARVETVNERMLHQLAEAGCRHVTYGVESGSYRIRKDVMRRPVKNDRFLKVFQWTKEAGIAVTANFMMGLPEETRDDLQQTLDLAEELEPYDFGYFVFYPYPGTHLFHYCRDKGYLPENYTELEANHRESILELPTLTQDDITEYYDRFTALRARLFAARTRAALGNVPTEVERASVAHVHAFARTG
jgi:anaerobic magnesium-protoporphyrin IX monomethyl ester cyclase